MKAQQLERLALGSFGPIDCPEPQLLADYALGMLDGNEQLRVAAHVRSCPLCSDDIAATQPPAPQPRRTMARLLSAAPVLGRREGGSRATVRQYLAADTSIHLTIAPPEGEHWQITGQVTREATVLVELPIHLRAQRRRYRQTTTTDAQGFFAFEHVPEGRYTLAVSVDQVQVQIRDLVLSLGEVGDLS